MEQNDFRIGVCIPTRDSWKADFGQSLAVAGMAFWPLLPKDQTGGITVYNKGNCSIVHQGRNNLVIKALLDGCTHILFLDDDMRLPMDTIARLYLHDKDIVAANCTTKEVPARVTAITEDGSEPLVTTEDSKGLEKCQSVGSAVMMVKRDVFLKLEMPWFDFTWNDEPKMFDPEGTEDSNKLDLLGEDRYFCHKAREAGYDIWIDHDLSKQVCHIGDWPYGHTFVPGYRKNGLTEEDITRRSA